MELASEELETTLEPTDLPTGQETVIEEAPLDFQWLTFIGVLPLLGLLPLLFVQAVMLWSRPHYHFAPVAILAAIGLVAIHFRVAAPDRKRFMTGLGIATMASVLAIVSVVFFLPTLAQVAATLVVFGWLLGQLGETRTSRILAIAMLIGCTIPLPYGWDMGLIRWLQGVAANWTSASLDALGILHLREGQIIFSRFFQLPITRVAGGVDSVFLLAGLAFFMIAARRHGKLAAIILLLSIPLWAISYGVVSQVILAIYGDSQADVTASLPFLAVRLLVLAIICISVILFDFGLVASLRPDHWESNAEDEWLEDEATLLAKPATAPLEKQGQARLIAMTIAASTLLAGIFATGMIATHTEAAFRVEGVNVAKLTQIAAADALPEQVQDWTRTEYAIETMPLQNGLLVPAFVWKYTSGVEQIRFALQAGSGSGNPIELYIRDGWQADDFRAPPETANKASASAADPGDSTSEAGPTKREIAQKLEVLGAKTLKNAVGEQAILLTAIIDTAGKPRPVSEAGVKGNDAWDTIFSKLSDARDNSVADAFEVHYLFMGLSGSDNLNPAAISVFEELVQTISARTAAQFSSTGPAVQ